MEIAFFFMSPSPKQKKNTPKKGTSPQGQPHFLFPKPLKVLKKDQILVSTLK